MSLFACQECGRKFRTVKSAENAALNGCPGCGGVDIDLDEEPHPEIKKLEKRDDDAISDLERQIRSACRRLVTGD